MDGLASASAVPPSLQGDGAVDIALLKKSQDLMATQAAALLQTLPPPPNPAGVGGKLDVYA
jgi:hypothetical protein